MYLSYACYFIPLLIPSLLASSKYEKDCEFPNIANIQDNLFPFMLVNVPLDGTVECFGIDARKIYRGDQPEPRSYNSLDSAYQRNRFVDGFVSQMIRRIEGRGGWR